MCDTITISDRFDQFWPINRKLMDSSGEDAFKYIPFRIYQVSLSTCFLKCLQIDLLTVYNVFDDILMMS